MRLIDADALMPLFLEKANTMKDRHGVKLGEEWLLNYNDIKDVIDNAPTVEERPQCEWEKPFEHNGKTYHKCTHCHISSELILIDNFCPNCGAKMTKEAENEI